jgi:hypothetical protein
MDREVTRCLRFWLFIETYAPSESPVKASLFFCRLLEKPLPVGIRKAECTANGLPFNNRRENVNFAGTSMGNFRIKT